MCIRDSDNSLGFRRNLSLKLIQLRHKAALRIGGYLHGNAAVGSDIVAVLQEIRREYDDLVLRIQNGSEQNVESAACADGHNDIVHVKVGSKPSVQILRHGCSCLLYTSSPTIPKRT